MKKITSLLLFAFLWAGAAYGQCINTDAFPDDPIPANNFGIVQELTTCTFTDEYSTISGVAIGADYIFTCISDDEDAAHKYITVTNTSNTVIAHGMSPLTVDNITASTIRLHFTENASCATGESCHITTLKAVLTCPLPINVAINSITTTGASFAWVAGATETAWEVLVLPATSAEPTPSTTGTTVSTSPLYTISTLTAGELYRFYVRANCGSEFSPWMAYGFSTACPSTTLFNDGFETTDIDEVPACWTAMLTEGVDASVGTVDFMAHTGDNAVQIANGDSPSTAKIMLISPPVSTLPTGTHRVKFFASGYGDVELEVGTVNTIGANATFTLKETIAVTDVYTQFVVDFTGYTGTDTFLAFRHPNSSNYNPIFLDDIRWEVSPLCQDVTELIVNAVTPASATIGWVGGGAETQWDVVYGTETATDPNVLTPITPAPTATPTATIPGLTPNTVYNAWVRSSCGSTLGNGAWIGPITFTTACLPTSVLNEDFNTTDWGELPDCWSAVMTGEGLSPNAYVQVNENDGVAESNAATLYNSDSENDYSIMLVSPNLGTLAAGTHRLKFYARAGSEGTSIDVGTISSPTAGGTFTNLQTVEITDEYTEYLVNFTGYTGPDTYLALKHVADIYTNIYIDNIRWEIAPLCADVTEIEVHSITTATASVSWLANSSEMQWDVVYGGESVTDPNTLTPISPAPTVSPGAVLNGLTPNTPYKVWVRSVCGGIIGTGAWIGPIEFRTACLPVGLVTEGFETTEYGEIPECWSALVYGPTVSQYAAVRAVDYDAATGDNAVEIYTSDSETDDYVMLVSPNLNTIAPGTHRLKFKAFTYGTSGLQIGTLNGNSSSATFTPFEDVNVGEEYTEYVINFDSYVGTDTYFALRNISQSTSVYIDDIKWEVLPLCPDVLDIELSQITTNSASVIWSAGTATGWQVAYGDVSVEDPATLTASSVLTTSTLALASLDDDASYNVWVRTVCGGANGNGAWMGPVTFSTLCLPGTVPYTQDFESTDAPDIPGCSILENAGNGNDWEITNDPGYGFNNNTLVY